MRSSRLRKLLAGLVTFTLVAGAVVLYLVFYVQDRRESLIERNFRVLAQISENIETQVKSIPRIALNDFSKGLEKLRQERKSSSGGSNAQQSRQRPNLKQGAETRNQQRASYTIARKRSVQRSGNCKDLTDEVQLHEDMVERVQVNRRNEGLVSELKLTDNTSCKFQVTDTYKNLLQPLIRPDVFSSYVLTDSSGQVLYSSDNLGVLQMDIHNWQDTRDLRESADKPKAGKPNVWINTLTEMRIGGTKYHVFSHPFKPLANEKFMLIGLVTESEFQQSTVRISSFRLIVFTVIFVVLLLSYPFLKLIFISHTEQLGFWDIISATVALFIATALSTLLIIDVFQYNQYRTERVSDGLKKVSGSISKGFEEELTGTLSQIEKLDQAHRQIRTDHGKMIDLRVDTAGLPDPHWSSSPGETGAENTIPHLTSLPLEKADFLNITWIGPDGMQKSKWTPQPANTRKISVATRSYFTEVINNRLWNLTDKEDSKSFFVSSIISYNTGDLLAAISMPSSIEGYPVITMTRQLRSLHNPVLSHGYNFAVIDTEGKVLFHSDGKRNLQENLLQELSDPAELQSLMLSRSQGEFRSLYHGEEYLFRIEPLKRWPVFLVVYFEEQNLLAANSEILTFSLISLTFYALLIILLLLFLFYYDSSRSKLKYRLFRLNWLIPHRLHRHAYMPALVLNLLLGGIFTALAWWSIHVEGNSYFTILFLLMNLAVISVAGIYLVLVQKFKTTQKFWQWLLFFTAVLLILIVSAFESEIQPKIYLLHISFSLAAVILCYAWSQRSRKRNSGSRPFGPLYRLMIFSLLLLWTLPMVFSSFKIAHDTEFLLYNRVVQLDLAQKFERHEKSAGLDSTVKLEHLPGYHLSPLLQAQFYTSSRFGKEPDGKNLLQQKFLKNYLKVRPMYSDPLVINSSHLSDSSGLLGKWFWKQPQHNLLNFYYRPGHNLLRISGRIYPYKGPVLYQDKPFLFLVLVLLLLLLLYTGIRFLYNKVVISNTTAMEKILSLESFMETEDGKDLKKDFLCYIGLPHSGKTNDLQHIKTRHPRKVQIVDLAENLSKTPAATLNLRDSTRLVILDHFEYAFREKQVNHQKLILLEALLSSGKTGVVLVSSVHPLDVLMEVEATEKDRWIRVLGNFKKTFFQSSQLMGPEVIHQELMDLKTAPLLARECDTLGFLQRIKPVLEKELSSEEARQIFTNDQLIIKIQSLATFYYYSVWNSCNAEEKYLLYDMAKDGLINTRNIRVINNLLNKGLIYHDGILKIVNLSFRNFILTTVQPEEALRIEQANKQDSTWAKLRTPFVLVLVGLAVFLFYTQRHVLDNMVAVLTAVGTVVVALMRFSGNLGLKNKSGTEPQ